MRPRNNRYLGAFFLHLLLCFIREHDQENGKGRVRIGDNNEKKIVVDENQGQLLLVASFFPVYFFCLTKRLDCLADPTFLTGANGLLLKQEVV